jgi:hypothetical protein
MANGSFNVALGREVEFHNRVDNSDPTNAVYVLVVLASAGLEPDSVLQDYDTLSAILAASNNEVTNSGYARIVISDTTLAAYTVDDTVDEIRLPLADQTFTSILVGDAWRKLLICYDSDSTGGTDADIIPVKYFDVLSTVTGQAIVPNGGDIIFSFPDGYHVAT